MISLLSRTAKDSTGSVDKNPVKHSVSVESVFIFNKSYETFSVVTFTGIIFNLFLKKRLNNTIRSSLFGSDTLASFTKSNSLRGLINILY